MSWLSGREVAAQIDALRQHVTRLRASLQEYVDYDLMTSDCPNCYMCTTGADPDDPAECIHHKAVKLLAELETES